MTPSRANAAAQESLRRQPAALRCLLLRAGRPHWRSAARQQAARRDRSLSTVSLAGLRVRALACLGDRDGLHGGCPRPGRSGPAHMPPERLSRLAGKGESCASFGARRTRRMSPGLGVALGGHAVSADHVDYAGVRMRAALETLTPGRPCCRPPPWTSTRIGSIAAGVMERAADGWQARHSSASPGQPLESRPRPCASLCEHTAAIAL